MRFFARFAFGVAASFGCTFLGAACSDTLLLAPKPIDDTTDGAVVDAGSDAAETASPITHLRIVAANISSGPSVDYAPDETVRLLQGLAPDIALLQEFNVGANAEGDLRGFVTAAFGATFAYYREPAAARIPNAIVSRYPILESGHWVDASVNDRSFVYAKIQVPGPKPLWAVSLHLLTTGGTARNTQAIALVGEVKRVIPVGDYLVLGGDLNTGSRQENCINTLGEIVDITTPVPDDGAGNDDTNGPRNKPLDWILADTDLAPFQTNTVLGTRSFAAGLVFDSRVYAPLTDVPPIRVGDSAYQNMQHMPIVKDFALPVP